MSPQYIPALKYHILSRYYDPVVRLTCREKTFKNRLIEQSSLRSNHRLLDVGCGTGTLTAWVKEKFPNVEVSCVDPDEAILAVARQKFRMRHAPIETKVGYAQALPFGDGHFDMVISSLLFHHLPTLKKGEALREIMRVLRPGGELRLADWDQPHNGLMKIAFFFLRCFDGFENTEANARGEMTKLIQEAGFLRVRRTDRFMTIFGTLSLWNAHKKR